MKFFVFAIFLLAAPLYAAPAPGDFVAQGPGNAKKISLTFDDGPGVNTEKFLDLLDKYKVKATFFMLGQQVQTRPKVARKVAVRGHEIGSHTYSHVNYYLHLKNLEKKFSSEGKGKDEAMAQSKEDLAADMKKTRQILEKTLDTRIKICRMPNGIDRPWIKEVAKKDGVVLVNWSFGADWTKETAEKLKQEYANAIQPGAILLFHDDGKNSLQTLEIVESVIQAAEKKGYSIVTVGNLIGLNQ